MLRREIIVTTQRAGFHAYTHAPDDVQFLCNSHRHLFKIKIGIPVTHTDRDREFFQEQRKLDVVVEELLRVPNVGSCEMLAERILGLMPQVRWCEVWEDGENGARIERHA